MKKNIIAIMILALAVVLTFTGCAPEKGSTVSTKTVRVIGTYGKMDSPASKALSRAAADNMGITSVDSVVVDGKDIKNDLKPVGNPKDGQNNVTFQAEVEVKDKVSFTAEAKDGFVFDEWEVMDAEDSKADKKLLKKIEKWLEKDGREHKETLADVPSEYIAYLVAEYDNGFYIDLDGKDEKKLTVDSFMAKDYKKDELTLVLSGSNDTEFTKLMTAINGMANLEELKIKSNGATLESIPSIEKLEEISLSGFTFSKDITINASKMEYKFEDCTFEMLTVNNAKEIEIEGGKAANIVVTAAEEAEFENITVSGTIDLTAMTEGEVEIEGIAKDKVKLPQKQDIVEF